MGERLPPRLPRGERLLESILWAPDDGYFLLDRHLQRLAASADAFAVPVDLAAVRVALDEEATRLAQPTKVRLLVDAHGRVEVGCEPAKPSTPVRAALDDRPVDPTDPFLHHKTTVRQRYAEALASVRSLECDDVLMWNTRGELTETASANLVLVHGGKRLTPPLESGLLAGTFRAELLARGELREQVLPVAALSDADEVWLVNSVRKWVRVHHVPRDDARAP